MSAATNSQRNETTSFLQIAQDSIQSGSNTLNTYAFLDSGSTVIFIGQRIMEKLRAKGTDNTLNIAGKDETENLPTERFP